MKAIEYYIQKEPYSIRRYVLGQNFGERWDQKEKIWTHECAPKDTCLRTKDVVVSKEEAQAAFPEAFQ